MFDPDTFRSTRYDLKARYIPELRGLFAKQAALPPALYDLEGDELHADPDFRAYMQDCGAVIDAFYRDGGTRDQWNNLFWAISEDVPDLRPDFAP